MSDMLRYKWTSFGPMLDEDGAWVKASDAEAAIAAIDALRDGPLTELSKKGWDHRG